MHLDYRFSAFLVLLAVVTIRVGDGELFTAIFRLKEAFQLEIKTTEKTLKNLEKVGKSAAADPVVVEFTRFVKANNAKHTAITPKAMTSYMEHPINIFHVIKRMANEWPNMVRSLEDVEELDIEALQKELETTLKPENGWPNTNDYNGVILQIISIQAVYLLDITEFATGTLNGTSTDPLSLDEIFDIAYTAYDANEFYQASLWYRGLADYLKKDRKGDKVTLRKALRKLASSYLRYGNFEKALAVTKEALENDPKDEKLLEDQKYYEEKLATAKSNGEELDKNLKLAPPPSTYEEDNFARYYALCRSDIKRPKSFTKKLKCKWKKTSIPYRPAKVEFLNYRPPVVLFHDVIYDGEIELVKKKVKPLMSRSVVVAETGVITSRSRISETTWMTDDDRLFARLSRRVSEVTGLSTLGFDKATHGEQMQVLNYGLGGMYEPHHDFLIKKVIKPDDPFFLDGAGDRLATWMFYATDVAVGGKTVFPLLNITVPVTKGAAAFWPNKYLNGTSDYRTLHAGCPVAIGSKWVLNKWTREHGQFNRWRCSKRRYKEVTYPSL